MYAAPPPSPREAPAAAAGLPGGGTLERLVANLEALEVRQRDLAQRVRLPAGSDHVADEAAGGTTLAVERSRFRLDLADDDVAAAVAPALAARPRRVLVFGVGLGEVVDRLLRELPRGAKVVAWERDPWLLRLALARADWRAALRTGRLRLALLSDLLAVAAERGAAPVVDHPLLARLYGPERRLLEAGPGERRALVRSGGLCTDSLVAGLGRRGWSVLTFDAQRASREELDLLARRFRPGLVAAINASDGLPEFCREHGAELLVWEIDPAMDRPPRPACPTDHVRLFTVRRAQAEAWRAAGLEHVELLPLAADDELRRPLPPGSAEVRPYAAPVAFVGSSLTRDHAALRARFAELHRAWCGRDDGAAVAAAVLAAQRAEPTAWILPRLLEEAAPGLGEWCRRHADGLDPAMLLGEEAASGHRKDWIRRLAPHGVHVWGDAGWRELEPAGVRYRGPAGHREELNRVYSSGAIHVDVGRLYQRDLVTLRVFDVLACGGFALVEHTAELERAFAVGEELESFRDPDELDRKVRHYLAHPDQARAIAARGRAAVLARHRFDDRLALALGRLPSAGAREPAA